MVASETRDKTNNDNGGWGNIHSPQSQQPAADFSPLSKQGETARCVVYLLHLGLWQIHVNRFNTLLKTARSSYLGRVETKTLYFELFSSSTSQRVSYWLSRETETEKEEDAGKAGGEPLLVWPAHTLYITNVACMIRNFLICILSHPNCVKLWK